MTTIKLRDDEVTVYTRGDTASFYVAIHLPDGGRHQQSLKTKSEPEARERAIKIYEEMMWRRRNGLTQSTRTFPEAAKAWLTELKKEIAAGVRKPRNLVDYEPVVTRYLSVYFANKPVDAIKTPDVARYRIWRRDYWISGPGAGEELHYERNGTRIKSNKTHAKRAPSPSTINGEWVVLRGIFKFAVTQGWMTREQIPDIENATITRRDSRARAYPHFSQSEYIALRRYMTPWVKALNINERERWRREAIQDFLLIMLNSGLREKELFKRDEKTKVLQGLRWKDVEYFTSDNGVSLVQLSVDDATKTGQRDVVPLRTVRYVLERRQARCPNAGPEDFVMALPDGSTFNTFASGVRRLFAEAKLLKDPKTGKSRNIYSCRHSYATGRVNASVNPQDLSNNMGTSLSMLDHRYYHFKPKDAADRLTVSRVATKAKAVAVQEDGQQSAVAEAFKMLLAGKLSASLLFVTLGVGKAGYAASDQVKYLALQAFGAGKLSEQELHELVR